MKNCDKCAKPMTHSAVYFHAYRVCDGKPGDEDNMTLYSTNQREEYYCDDHLPEGMK